MVYEVHQLEKKEEYALSEDNVLALRNAGIANEVSDVLMQVLRDGAAGCEVGELVSPFISLVLWCYYFFSILRLLAVRR